MYTKTLLLFFPIFPCQPRICPDITKENRSTRHRFAMSRRSEPASRVLRAAHFLLKAATGGPSDPRSPRMRFLWANAIITSLPETLETPIEN